MKIKDIPDIDFEKYLNQGHASYEKKVGHWWRGQAGNRAHQSAYKHISKYISTTISKFDIKPKFLLDYACGDGSFMLQLAQQLPQSKFVGLDGSSLMLNNIIKSADDKGIAAKIVKSSECFTNKASQISLVKTVLPNFNLETNKADVIVFLFPNLTCSDRERRKYEKNGYKNSRDRAIAEMLARFREMDPEDEVAQVDYDECLDELMTARVISNNLHSLVKKGGLLYRVDYANAPREELSQLTQWRSLFTECALEESIKGKKSTVCFKYLESEYRRSQVILDVFHQTGDESDRTGGYFCSIFQAV